jgi:uncharacterized membrane protein YfcA
MIYMANLDEEPATIRAQSAVFFMCTNVTGIISWLLLKGFPPGDLPLFAISIPVMIAGTYLGLSIANHISKAAFTRLILYLLILAGAASLIKGLW